MARKGGNPDLKGNKNSGRGTLYEEHHKTEAVNRLWEKVNNKVRENIELTEYEKDLVKSVLPKTIKAQSTVELKTPTAVLVEFVDEATKEDTNTEGLQETDG